MFAVLNLLIENIHTVEAKKHRNPMPGLLSVLFWECVISCGCISHWKHVDRST